jgi:hypothetical protein
MSLRIHFGSPVLVLLLVLQGVANAEWTDDEAVLAKAETAMIEYASRLHVPDTWAAFGRGTTRGIAYGGERIAVEKYFTLIASTNHDPGITFFSHGIVDKTVNQMPTSVGSGGSWAQEMRRGLKFFRKGGYPFNTNFEELDDPNKVKGTDQEYRGFYRPFDPFTLTIACYVNYVIGTSDANYAERWFLRSAELVKAEYDEKKETIAGAWLIRNAQGGGSVSTIVFSKKAGWNPILAVHRTLVDGNVTESLKTGRIFSHTESRWERHAENDEKALYFPIAIRVFHHPGKPPNDSHGENEFFFQWKTGKDAETAFPQPADIDWREPMRKLFEEDFNRYFDREKDGIDWEQAQNNRAQDNRVLRN